MGAMSWVYHAKVATMQGRYADTLWLLERAAWHWQQRKTAYTVWPHWVIKVPIGTVKTP